MHKSKRWLLTGTLLFFLLIGLIGATERSSEKGHEALYERLDLFTKVLHFVKNDYVEEVKDEDLINGAIRGLLASLDPHSAFLSADTYEELRVDTEGRFGGVGLEITVKENQLVVVSPIEGSPADKAGIREGDRILKINGTPTREMTLADAVRKMRGRKGEKIILTLMREGLKEPFEVRLVRDTIRIKSIRSELLDEEYGYVRITSFQQGTANELKKTLRHFERQAPPIRGLLLDLRNNPGGLLDEALVVADEFLKEGTIVSTVSRNREIDKKEARPDGTEPSYPMIVLINGGSASASEIVAGALQDHRRAVLLGAPTFGKGSVQTLYELGQGAALKLTVARYLTPSGRSIQAVGIHPDVVVESRESTESVSLKERFVREKDLKGHLEGTPKRTPTGQRSRDDFQLEAALNYLKSWNVFEQQAP